MECSNNIESVESTKVVKHAVSKRGAVGTEYVRSGDRHTIKIYSKVFFWKLFCFTIVSILIFSGVNRVLGLN